MLKFDGLLSLLWDDFSDVCYYTRRLQQLEYTCVCTYIRCAATHFLITYMTA